MSGDLPAVALRISTCVPSVLIRDKFPKEPAPASCHRRLRANTRGDGVWGSGASVARTASAPRLALSKATFPIAPEACAGPRRAPFRKESNSRRCINIQMPLSNHASSRSRCEVHRRRQAPISAPARSRVPCEGSPRPPRSLPARGQPTARKGPILTSPPAHRPSTRRLLSSPWPRPSSRPWPAASAPCCSSRSRSRRKPTARGRRPPSPSASAVGHRPLRRAPSFGVRATPALPRRPGAPGEGLGLLHLRRRSLRLLRGLWYWCQRRGQLLRDVRRLESSYRQAGRRHRVGLRVLRRAAHGLERRQNY